MRKVIIDVMGKKFIVDEPSKITVLVKNNKKNFAFDLRIDDREMERLRRFFRQIKKGV